MVHFTCDLCGKDLTSSGEIRFVVKISAYPGSDPDRITEGDLDEDHMEEVSDLIRREQQLDSAEFEAQGFKGFRFDLCPCCHKKYINDPLGREFSRADISDFSKN